MTKVTFWLKLVMIKLKSVEKIFGNNDFLLINKVKDYSKLDRVLIFMKKKIKK